MNKKLNIFERFLFEAPEDDVPPDMVDVPPDIPEGAENDAPPDLAEPDMSTDDTGGPDEGSMDDSPPDMPDEFGEDEFTDDTGTEGEIENPDDKLKNLGLDEKISAIMNQNLYQRYLALLNNINGQLTMIKNNSDILYTLSSDSLSIIDSLKKLDENIRLYLKNSFINENYSKNLLFFNKCLNLLKLLNDVFDSDIKKGIRAIK